MAPKSLLYQLALEANERQVNIGDDVLPVPTLDERVTLYLRAVHGNREFTEEERSTARDILLNSMAVEMAAQGISAEQSLIGELSGRERTDGPDGDSFLAQYFWPRASEAARRKEPISVAPRRLTSRLALPATFALVLIVAGGTLGYRWHAADQLTGLERQPGKTQLDEKVAPPSTSPRSLSNRPAPDEAAPERHVVQIASPRSEGDVLAVFRRLQEEQPRLFGQATLNFGQSYSARVGPFASEKDAAEACLALAAADIRCF